MNICIEYSARTYEHHTITAKLTLYVEKHISSLTKQNATHLLYAVLDEKRVEAISTISGPDMPTDVHKDKPPAESKQWHRWARVDMCPAYLSYSGSCLEG